MITKSCALGYNLTVCGMACLFLILIYRNGSDKCKLYQLILPKGLWRWLVGVSIHQLTIALTNNVGCSNIEYEKHLEQQVHTYYFPTATLVIILCTCEMLLTNYLGKKSDGSIYIYNINPT